MIIPGQQWPQLSWIIGKKRNNFFNPKSFSSTCDVRLIIQQQGIVLYCNTSLLLGQHSVLTWPFQVKPPFSTSILCSSHTQFNVSLFFHCFFQYKQFKKFDQVLEYTIVSIFNYLNNSSRTCKFTLQRVLQIIFSFFLFFLLLLFLLFIIFELNYRYIYVFH